MKIINVKRLKNKEKLFRVLVSLNEEEEKEATKLRDKLVKSKDFYWFITSVEFEVGSEISFKEIEESAIVHGQENVGGDKV